MWPDLSYDRPKPNQPVVVAVRATLSVSPEMVQ